VRLGEHRVSPDGGVSRTGTAAERGGLGRGDSAGWPCRYEGVEAGFEFLAFGSREQDLAPEVAAAIGLRDLAVSLITHSDMRELMTSVISGLVLASMADGVFWDTEGNEITRASEAIERARTFEVETRPLLERWKRR
jgi:hypothetical protein